VQSPGLLPGLAPDRIASCRQGAPAPSASLLSVAVKVRLRQVALVAHRLEPVESALRSHLGLGEPFRDPGVAEFGLENAVVPLGDTFLEVVSPVRPDTTAGRYLKRRGGDGGYMAIFQLEDLAWARHRLADLGVRVVWRTDLPDIAGTHLHPKDVPGALVSLDWAEPPGSWRWGGPSWTGTVPEHGPGGIVGLTVQTADPLGLAGRWAEVLGRRCEPRDGDAVVAVDGAELAFVPLRDDRGEGIHAVAVAVPEPEGRAGEVTEIGGVRFEVRRA